MSNVSDRFSVRFWGVRGSLPVPGPETARYGGNTTCVEVRCGDTLIIIDAGSGIRELGRALLADDPPVRCHLLISHVHWDHIQGFPFFAPGFVDSTHVTIWSENNPGRPVADTLALQMSAPMFPIGLDTMTATLDFRTFELGQSFQIGGATIRTGPLNHPGGATGYRIDYAGRSYVHASDHEHTDERFAPLIELARDADWLVYDAAYTDDEYDGVGLDEPRRGWGHSTWREAIRTAREANVPNLVLFQHQYERTDAQLDAIAIHARDEWPGTVVSREGMQIDLLSGRVTPEPPGTP